MRKHTNKSPLLGVGLVKLDHLLEGEVADDVRVEHEEGLLVRCEHVAGERERTRSAQGLGLLGDVDIQSKLCGGCACVGMGMCAGE